MTNWFHFDLSSAYSLSGSYVSRLLCYITSGYSFVWIHSIYSPPSAVLSVVPQGSVLGLHLFINYCICNSIRHSKYYPFADTIKTVHSISSATDSTLPQSDTDCIHSRCAADLTLTILKSQAQCWLRVVLVRTLVPLCTLTYSLSTTDCSLLLCYTQLVLSNNMPHLSAVTLWLLMPIGQNTSNRSLQLYASVPFFHHTLYNHIYAL